MELCAVATFRGERRGQKRQRRRVRDTVGVGWGGAVGKAAKRCGSFPQRPTAQTKAPDLRVSPEALLPLFRMEQTEVGINAGESRS